MNARKVRTALQRAARHSRDHQADAPVMRRDGSRLDPATVDAVLEDDRMELAKPESAAPQPQPSASQSAATSEATSLLSALRDQLAELDAHQSQIRALLDQVERQATSPRD